MSAMDAEDIDLDYTRAMRKRIVDEMTKKGLPDDTKDKALVLAALDGIDRAALTKKRIKSDEGISNTKALAAETIAQLFMDPRLKRLGETIEVSVREVPQLAIDLPMPDIVDGELDSNAGAENYESFMKRNQPDNAD